MIFTVQVFFTDRNRNSDGGYVTYWTTVEILTDSSDDAICAGIQLAMAHRIDALDVMPLAAQIVI